MVEFSDRSATGRTIRLTPNRSLGDPQLVAVFAALGLGCVGFAFVLATQGFWVSLPFAGAEVFALGWAFWWVRGKLQRAELIEVAPETVRITRRHGQQATSVGFHPGWLKIELRSGGHRWYPKRLIVSCQGRELEIGSFLTDSEREWLADQLIELTRPYSAWAAS